MTIYRNIDDLQCYIIEHIMISMCVCGQCGIGYFAHKIFSNSKDEIEITPDQIGTKFIPISEI